MTAGRAIVLITFGFLAVRLGSATMVTVPGYTDAYYYVDVARNLAHGDGLVADFVWDPVEAPGLAALPLPSHRFWMPLATVIQAAGISILGSSLGAFRAAQAVVILLAAALPFATYAAARRLGAGVGWSLVAATLTGLGGLFAPAWVTLDSFSVAALLGTIFFVAFGRAAGGSVPAGVVAGLSVGLLFLARAEAALFGIALLALAMAPRARAAALAGCVGALCIGLVWLARDIGLGSSGDVLARSALLVRYEDFFALRSPTLDAFREAFPEVAAAKAAALGTNAVTFIFAFALIPIVGMAAGLRTLFARPEVRAFAGLTVIVFLGQSLVWTLHSTRGSYVHSLAAFVPFGLALSCAGAEALLTRVASGARSIAVAAALGTSLAMSVASIGQFDGSFGETERARRAAVPAIPGGPFLAIDAAAWRWVADRPVIVTPADGLDAAGCVAATYGARSVVLEAPHFSAYDELYRTGRGQAWLGTPTDVGTIRVFPIIGDIGCSLRR